jgi:hypothetical protein
MKRLYGMLVLVGLFFETTCCQSERNCNIPYHASLDSLIHYAHLYADSGTYTFRQFGNSQKLPGMVDFWNPKLDSILFTCEDYLIDKMGQDMYCSNVELWMNQFMLPYRDGTDIRVHFLFSIPGTTKMVPARHGGATESYDNLSFYFIIGVQTDSTYTIKYPNNIPDCKSSPDCGFISRDSAIAIAIARGFISSYDNYYIDMDSKKAHWMVSKPTLINSVRDEALIDAKTGDFFEKTPTTRCLTPIHVTIDSLIAFLRGPGYKHYQGWQVVDSNLRKHNYESSWNMRLDSAFSKCQDFLIEKLGQDNYCKYISMQLVGLRSNPISCNSTVLRARLHDSLTYLATQEITFNMAVPNSKRVEKADNGKMISVSDGLRFTFTIKLKEDSSIVIIYPNNLPECKGPDCGWITWHQADSIAKKEAFLSDTDEYIMRVDDGGTSWQIKKTIARDWIWDNASVNLQTGEFKLLGRSQRID